jgi:hypothetical protein
LKTLILLGLIGVAAASASTWRESVEALRKSESNESNTVALYQQEQKGIPILEQLFKKNEPWGAQFRKFLTQNPHANDYGKALDVFLGKAAPNEVQANEVLAYIHAHPGSIIFLGNDSITGALSFEVDESYAKLKKFPGLAARKIVFERELDDVPSACTPIYDPKWQDWTEEECTSYVSSLVELFAKFPEPTFKEAKAREIKRALAQIEGIKVKQDYAQVKRKVLSNAKAILVLPR